MQAEIRRSIISGTAQAPPSAPLAHRALVLATLTPGQTQVSNLPPLAGIYETISACRSFGADIVHTDTAADVFGPEEFASPAEVQCGASNTTFKLILPLCASLVSEVKINGSERMAKKDLSLFFDFLGQAGAETSYSRFLPAGVKGPFSVQERIYPGKLGSQFLSGILLCAPLLGQDASIGIDEVVTGWPYARETISMMKEYGIQFYSDSQDFLALPGGQAYSPPEEIVVPASPHLSSFLLLTGALCGKATVKGSCDWQSHHAVFSEFGAGVSIRRHEISVSAASLKGAKLDAPELGSLLPHALVLASVAGGGTKIGNLHSLPRSHLMRAQKLARELGKMGAKIEREGDSFSITGGKLSGAKIDAGGDAAVGMACATAAVAAQGPSTINGTECILAAYPNFLRDLVSLGAIVR